MRDLISPLALMDEVERLRAELARRDEQIAAVRKLHAPHWMSALALGARCFACDNDYPCPTIRYLDGAS